MADARLVTVQVRVSALGGDVFDVAARQNATDAIVHRHLREMTAEIADVYSGIEPWTQMTVTYG